jgi:NADH-quinone oxidoreductase subunit M
LLFGFLYERRHARLMSDYGGIAKVMPVYTAFFVIVTFSSIAVPGTNGFVGEFLVLLGTFKSNLPMAFGILATTCVVLGAAYMLWMVQKVFFGQVTHQENLGLKDLNLRELSAAIPLLLLITVMGLKPQPVLDVLASSTNRFVARARFGTGDDVDERKVRVYVRALPTQAVVAMAAPTTPTLAAPVPTMIPAGLLRARAMPPMPAAQPSANP